MPRLGDLHALAPFERERFGDDGDRQRARFAREFGDDRRRAGARAAAHAGGDEHEVGAVEDASRDPRATLRPLRARVFGFAPAPRPRVRLAADLHAVLGQRVAQRLHVGVDREEVDAAQDRLRSCG